MHRLHQTSTLILATILLSTSLLSSCHSPVENSSSIRDKEFVPGVPPTPGRRQKISRTYQMKDFLELCKENIKFSDLCSQTLPTPLVEALAENLQQKPSNLSLEEWEQVVYKAVIEEAQKLDLKFSATELRKISAFVTQIYVRPRTLTHRGMALR